ncbi:hypothetical protein ACWX0K_20380 [Nitrobacteraceae bacterium UC4446_H13]
MTLIDGNATDASLQSFFLCEVCLGSFLKDRKDRKWCPDCKPLGVARYKKEQRRKAGTISVGSNLTCKNCGESFQKQHKRQFYCEPCMLLAATEKLPSYVVRQRTYQRKYEKQKRIDDPRFVIAGRMSAGISNSLRDGKGGRSWERLVGYTVDDPMSHLERQFLPGMSWDNRALWHIDHIVPQSAFRFDSVGDPDFLRAWALTNLRPLWAVENIKKSAKRLFLI